MADFPTLRNGKVAMAGTELGRKTAVRVVQFETGHEQRWKVAPELFDGNISLSRINGYELGLVRQWFDANKGSADTFSLTIDGDTWDYLVCESQDLSVKSDGYDRYAVDIKVRQTRVN